MDNKTKIIIISLSTIFLIGIILILCSQNKPEIVKVGEIPKAFNNQTTKLPLPKKKEIKKETLVKSEVSDNTIYLTFDDGPSHLTAQILDILKQEQVAATFFVIGPSLDKYKDVIKRAHDEGHTIALHSNTHNYSYIYSSDENYFNDLNTIKSRIYNIIGVNSRIIRLPGGSSNTVSKKYNKNIITRITNKLTENEYYYFDWNVDSKDASGKISADNIYQNTISNLHHGTNIVLMHDAASKKSTVEALSNIIKYGKNNGYTFAKISKNTRTTHHHINN